MRPPAVADARDRADGGRAGISYTKGLLLAERAETPASGTRTIGGDGVETACVAIAGRLAIIALWRGGRELYVIATFH
jgi:hypothetical protein